MPTIARPPLLRQPVFVALVLTALVSNIGSWMQAFSEQWLVVQLAGAEAPRWAGRLGFSTGIAMLLLMPFGGALGDRYDRRHVLAFSQAWLAGVAFSMAALALVPDGLTLGRLVAFAAATGVGLGVASPMLNSVLPQVVGHDDLTAASGWMSAQFNLSRITGPALAAFVLSVVGMAGNFFLNALSFIGLILVALRLPPARTPTTGLPVGSYRLAVERCLEDSQLRAAMSLALVAGIFAWSYHTFVAVYAVRYLHADANGAAMLLAAYGLGAIGGSMLLSLGPSRPEWGRLRTFFATYGLALLVIGLLPHYRFTLLVAAGLGVSHGVFGNLLSVVVQRRAPEALRSRISALYVMAILGTTPFGNLVAGEVAQALGFNGVRWVLGGQGVILMAAATWSFLRRAEETSGLPPVSGS